MKCDLSVSPDEAKLKIGRIIKSRFSFSSLGFADLDFFWTRL